MKRCTQENEDLNEKEQIEEGEISEVHSEETVEKEANELMEKKEGGTQIQKENKKEEGKVSEVEGEMETEKEVEWSEITPGKASRSPNTRLKELEYGQVALLTKSRYSVLSPEDEEERQDEVETEKSMEIVEEMEEIKVSRQILPRESKLNHRYLGEKGSQSSGWQS